MALGGVSEQQLRFGVWAFVTAVYAATAVVLVVGYIQFKKKMVLTIVQRRYPRLVLLETVLAIIATIFVYPFQLLLVYDLDEFRPYQRGLHIFTYTLFPTFHVIAYCEVCRLWLISYDLRCLHWMQDEAWKVQINSQFGSRNWWLSHRSTYGNSRYLVKRFLCCGLVSGIVGAVLHQVYSFAAIALVVNGMLYSLTVFACIGLYYKCPKNTKDRFLFLQEFKYTAIIYSVSLSLYGLGTVVSWFSPLVGHFMISVAVWWVLPGVSIVSTLWIPKQILSASEWKAFFAEDTTENRGDDKLSDLFNDCHRFEAFACHLNREFSLEVLLAFIEMIQFKQYFRQVYFGEEEEAIALFAGCEIRFNFGKQPLRSEIVYDTVSLDNCNTVDASGLDAADVNKQQLIDAFKKIAYSLYIRYIREACELEINIASKQRATFVSLMSDELKWLNQTQIGAEELSCIFDSVCKELYSLMNHTFARFKNTEKKSARAEEMAEIILSMSASSSPEPVSLEETRL